MILSNNFSYKYTEQQRKIYAIIKGNPLHVSRMHIYSVPHISKEVPYTRNVLLGFTDENLCLDCTKELKRDHDGLSVITMGLSDFRQIGNMMGMPIAVIIDKEADEVLNTCYNIYFNAN